MYPRITWARKGSCISMLCSWDGKKGHSSSFHKRRYKTIDNNREEEKKTEKKKKRTTQTDCNRLTASSTDRVIWSNNPDWLNFETTVSLQQSRKNEKWHCGRQRRLKTTERGQDKRRGDGEGKGIIGPTHAHTHTHTHTYNIYIFHRLTFCVDGEVSHGSIVELGACEFTLFGVVVMRRPQDKHPLHRIPNSDR